MLWSTKRRSMSYRVGGSDSSQKGGVLNNSKAGNIS